jgi:hypothetical protein
MVGVGIGIGVGHRGTEYPLGIKIGFILFLIVCTNQTRMISQKKMLPNKKNVGLV